MPFEYSIEQKAADNQPLLHLVPYGLHSHSRNRHQNEIKYVIILADIILDKNKCQFD